MSKFTTNLDGVEELERELGRLHNLDITSIRKRQLVEIFNRGKRNTPVGLYPKGSYRKGGQLRKSLKMTKDEVGYSKEYAPHIEYGHRTINGGFVQGQFFLKENVDEQREIYIKDLKSLLRNRRG